MHNARHLPLISFVRLYSHFPSYVPELCEARIIPGHETRGNCDTNVTHGHTTQRGEDIEPRQDAEGGLL